MSTREIKMDNKEVFDVSLEEKDKYVKTIEQSSGKMFKNKIDMVEELSLDTDSEGAKKFDTKNSIAQKLIHTVTETRNAAEIVRRSEEEEEDYGENTLAEINTAKEKLANFLNNNEGRSAEIKKRPNSENMEVE